MKNKPYLPLIFFLLFTQLVSTIVLSQEPDLSKLTNIKAKTTAWLNYCSSLRYSNTHSPANYGNLKIAAIKGLGIADKNDDESRSQFFFWAAIGDYYQVKFDSAQYYFYQSLALAQKIKSAKIITNVCVALIPVNFQLRQQQKVDSCKNILQLILDTAHDKSILEDGYYAMGNYYQEKSYYSTAQDYLLKGIELRKHEIDTTQNIKLKADYAIQCYMLSKEYQNVEVLFPKSLAILQEGYPFANASPTVFNRYLSAFTEVYSLLGKIDSALYYENELEKATKNSATVPSEMVVSNLNIAKYYIAHNETDNAFPYVSKASELATQSKSPILIYQAQLWMARYLEKAGKNQAAIELLAQSLPVAKQINKEQFVEGLNYMAIAQTGAGNFKAAADYYEQYVAQSDSLTNEKTSRNFADQETRYETNKKELRIISLDKENRLNILELQSASHLRVLLIVGLVAIGIIALLLYFIYRNKEKANLILNQQNDQLEKLNKELALANETKARLFGIIGHDLRSPISQIVQLLELQKENPDLLSADAKQRHENKLKIASENVLETMEDLLLWSKSQMQNFTPNLMPVNVSAIVQKELSMLQPRADEKNIIVDNQLPTVFKKQTDENFIAIIIRNLLQNAIKYGNKNSTILIAENKGEIHIANQTDNVNVEIVNGLLKNKNVNSKSFGLGLQIANDLANAININIVFKQTDNTTLMAILNWGNN